MSKPTFTMPLPPPVFTGRGTYTPPPLSHAELNAICLRAMEIDDQQTKDDMFRLLSVLGAISAELRKKHNG